MKLLTSKKISYNITQDVQKYFQFIGTDGENLIIQSTSLNDACAELQKKNFNFTIQKVLLVKRNAFTADSRLFDDPLKVKNITNTIQNCKNCNQFTSSSSSSNSLFSKSLEFKEGILSHDSILTLNHNLDTIDLYSEFLKNFNQINQPVVDLFYLEENDKWNNSFTLKDNNQEWTFSFYFGLNDLNFEFGVSVYHNDTFSNIKFELPITDEKFKSINFSTESDNKIIIGDPTGVFNSKKLSFSLKLQQDKISDYLKFDNTEAKTAND